MIYDFGFSISDCQSPMINRKSQIVNRKLKLVKL